MTQIISYPVAKRWRGYTLVHPLRKSFDFKTRGLLVVLFALFQNTQHRAATRLNFTRHAQCQLSPAE